jgi:hypothetical protein
MAKPIVFPELIKEGIEYAATILMGLPSVPDVHIATRVLILKHLTGKLPFTYEEMVNLVDIDVLPSEDNPDAGFRVRVRPKETE